MGKFSLPNIREFRAHKYPYLQVVWSKNLLSQRDECDGHNHQESVASPSINLVSLVSDCFHVKSSYLALYFNPRSNEQTEGAYY